MSEPCRPRRGEGYEACDDECPKYYDDEVSAVRERPAGEGNIDRQIRKGVTNMLCLSLLPGEYLTIGNDVVVQVDRMTGDRCKLVIHAPREIPVVRGEVLERGGGERPGCVFETPRWRRPEIPWNQSKAQALAAMRTLLSNMDGRDSDVQALRRQLNHMFPPAPNEAEQTTEVSNG